jgi:hypothetical protein
VVARRGLLLAVLRGRRVTLHRVKLCGCGHEQDHHVILEDGSRGACVPCRNHRLPDVDPCPRFHSRASANGGPPPAPAMSPFDVFERRVLDALTELRGLVGFAQTVPASRPAARQVPRMLQHEGGLDSPDLIHHSPTNGHRALGRCERALLQVLAQRRERETSRAQLAVLSGYSSKSSGFDNALGSLRSRGLVEGLRITSEGSTVATPEPLPTGGALFQYWSSRLGKCERALLGQLRVRDTLSRDQLAAWSGYSEASSSFQNALGRLRTLELVEGGRDAITLVEELRPS